MRASLARRATCRLRRPARRDSRAWAEGPYAVPIRTIEDYLRAMETSFAPERARGQQAILQYTFSGREAGTCHAVITDGTIRVAVGPHPAPTVEVHADFDLWMEILAYRVDGLMAYQKGRYTIVGDPALLIDSNAWFVR